MRRAALADVFDPRRNSLNALRLVLASLVIFRHGLVVTTGTLDSSLWMDQVFGQLPVDGFFALSGFLIARSWMSRPNPRAFLTARIGRIYPGFWVCLMATALLFRPLSALIAGQPLGLLEVVSQGARYVVVNASLVMFSNDIVGTPTGVPWRGDWNGSLWTLKWEFACYLGVMVLGLLGVLMRRSLMVGMWIAAVVIAVVVSATSLDDIFSVQTAARFLLMYLSGIVIYLLADVLPVSRGSAMSALICATGGAVVIPDYRLVMALPLAYGLVGIGSTCYSSVLRFDQDISYGMYIYGFPIEQLLAHSAALRDLGAWPFSLLACACTVPCAAASWFLVEKRAARALKRWSRRRATGTDVAVPKLSG